METSFELVKGQNKNIGLARRIGTIYQTLKAC
jgi:hypothetical protein